MVQYSPSETLRSFIVHAREKGMDHGTIRMLLLSAGWKERDIAQAIGAEGLTQPVPVPPDAGGARDAFFHLLAFVGLYTLVISTLILLFQYINYWFPDPALDPSFIDLEGMRTTIRWSLAALIVTTPLYLWMSRLLLTEMRKDPEKEHGGVRRWLTYLTLFVAASVLLGDLVTLLFRLLEGEISIRFLFKIAAVLAVAGSVFWYYLQSLRHPLQKHGALHRIGLVILSFFLIPILIIGFVLAGSPGAERERKIDDRRVEDLRTIANAVIDIAYDGMRWQGPDILPIVPVPQTLEEVASQSRMVRVSMEDPAGLPYEYLPLSETAFRLCTVFDVADTAGYTPFWDHPAGRHCYEFDVERKEVP